jgi:60kDa lysophospholipase
VEKNARKEDMTGANLARVLVIYCGGTIGMKKDPVLGYRPVKGYLTEYLKSSRRFHDGEYATSPEGMANDTYGIKSMDTTLGDVLVLPVSMYGKRVAYQIYEYDTLKDSCNVNSKDWLGFARDIETHYHHYDSFIILHGTDTMAYTASALSFLLENLGKTVIITGSQIPFSELRNDAHENFLGALTLAGHYVIPEVTIFFDNRLLRGNRSRKVNAVDFYAFDSPNMKPLAEMGTSIDIDWPHIMRQVVAPFKAWTKMNDHVGCFRLFPGISVEAVRALTAAPMRGIVLESFGAGNAPDDRPDLLQAIKDACDKGVIIVNVTQCTKGSAGQSYATGHAISQAGVISGLDMTAECALAKLNYLLSHDYDNATVKRMLMEPLRGELTIPTTPMKEQDPQQSTLLGKIMSDAVQSCMDANRDAVELTLRPLLLHQAAADGDISALEEICKNDLHIDQVNHEHRTCLFAAICNGHLKTVKWLVTNGCNIHHRDTYENTPVSCGNVFALLASDLYV